VRKLLQTIRVTELPSDFSAIETESLALGFSFLKRLREEWQSRENRFDRPGECIFVALQEAQTIGIGGLNIDPYLKNKNIGRIRHLYVTRRFRNMGIGKLLVKSLIESGSANFTGLRLRTESADAALFYERLGFKKIDNPTATHEITLL
jgi:GNAT superfamily N-acetyltransferase